MPASQKKETLAKDKTIENKSKFVDSTDRYEWNNLSWRHDSALERSSTKCIERKKNTKFAIHCGRV